MAAPQTNPTPPHPANRLGLDYRLEAARLPWSGPIWDVHTHLEDVPAARRFFEAAEWFGVERVWSMTQLEQVDAIREVFGQRVRFIAVPNYDASEDPRTFTTDWLRRIERFAEKGCRVCKFWAAPRGVDYSPELRLDSPIRREAMRLARSLGMAFMVHVGDPDIWFASKYRDARRYGTKAQHQAVLERVLDDFGDVPFIAAHLAGDPEHLDRVQGLLDRHRNLYLDTSATKWMVRELSKKPEEFRGFCQRNAGRVVFGSDIVAEAADLSFDLFASRYWALRTLLETDYDSPSPIDDPDLLLADSGLSEPPEPPEPPEVPRPQEPTVARLRGAKLDEATLGSIYRAAAEGVLGGL
jgi:predicted TIM-barrel fold metal-dependent hydrolase